MKEFSFAASLIPSGTGGMLRQSDDIGSMVASRIGVQIAIGVGIAILTIVLIVVARVLRNKAHNDAVAQGVHLAATITGNTYTGVQINSIPQVRLDLAFVYQGQPKTGSAKILLPPGQTAMPGEEIIIAYDPQSGKITPLSEDDEVLASGGNSGMPTPPQTVFATVTGVQPTGYTYKNAAVVQLAVALDDGRTAQIPALEAAVAPYIVGEVLELDLPEGNTTYANISSRSPNYKFERRSIQGELVRYQCVVTNVDDPGIAILGRKVLGMELAAQLQNGTMLLSRALLPPVAAVVPAGAELPGGMEKAHFDYRMALQNKLQGAAVVQDIQYTGYCFGSSPFCRITLAVDGAEGAFVAEEGQGVHAVPQAGQRVWAGYDPQTRQATIIRFM